MEYICLFFPAIVGVLHYESITNKKMNYKEFVMYYALYNIIINLANWIIIYFIFNNNQIIFSLIFCIKYLLLSMVFSIVFPILIIFFEKNVRIKIDVKKDYK